MLAKRLLSDMDEKTTVQSQATSEDKRSVKKLKICPVPKENAELRRPEAPGEDDVPCFDLGKEYSFNELKVKDIQDFLFFNRSKIF